LLNNLYYEYLLSEGVKKEQIIKLALDDDRNREYRNPDNLSKFLYSKITNETEKFYFLLDEVQFAISDEEIKSK
jgi:predicted AAA+ superfamily ATPase